jgi:hypothetical protein
MSITKSAVKNLRREFLGEVIIVYLRDTLVPMITEEQAINVNAMVSGVCVEIDQDHIYLDNKAISHDIAGLIELAPTGLEAMMDDIGPSDEREIN